MSLDLVYEIECTVCGKKFLVPKSDTLTPEHPLVGENLTPGTPFIPCAGSSLIGIPLGPKKQDVD
jgi:hypothetical protein